MSLETVSPELFRVLGPTALALHCKHRGAPNPGQSSCLEVKSGGSFHKGRGGWDPDLSDKKACTPNPETHLNKNTPGFML